MKEYLISIIVPVYNQKKERLERCIDSLCGQTYHNIEVIVVDDGSKEECLTVVKQICSKDQRIRVISQENKGAGAARNLGITEASGEYIVFVDSDDMLSEYAMEDAISCLNSCNADLVVGQIHKEREVDWCKNIIPKVDCTSNHIVKTADDFNEYINHILGFECEKYVHQDRYFCDGPVAKLCRTEIARQALFDNNNFWSEDTIWNLKVSSYCKTISISENVWYYAFANEDSQTHIFRPKCEFEFSYRIKQEHELVAQLWPDCLLGLYTQIWLSTHYLFACYLIHRDNKDTFGTKYKCFLRCTSLPEYREMLRNISFENEEVKYKRIIKQTIKFFNLHTPKLFAYLGWSLMIKGRKGER